MPVDPLTDLAPVVASATNAASAAERKAQGSYKDVIPPHSCWIFLGGAVGQVGVAIGHLANIGKILGRKADNHTLALDVLSAKVDSLSVNVATLTSLVRKLEGSAPATIAQQSAVPRPTVGGSALRGNEPGPDRLPQRVDRGSAPAPR